MAFPKTDFNILTFARFNIRELKQAFDSGALANDEIIIAADAKGNNLALAEYDYLNADNIPDIIIYLPTEIIEAAGIRASGKQEEEFNVSFLPSFLSPDFKYAIAAFYPIILGLGNAADKLKGLMNKLDNIKSKNKDMDFEQVAFQINELADLLNVVDIQLESFSPYAGSVKDNVKKIDDFGQILNSVNKILGKINFDMGHPPGKREEMQESENKKDETVKKPEIIKKGVRFTKVIKKG